MDLTGPTDAVECFRFRNGAKDLETHLTASRFRNLGRIAVCGKSAFALHDLRASRADIHLGFVGDLCPKCKAALEDGLDSRTREA